MKLSNRNYDVLKWVVSIVLPALTLFLSVVFNQFNWQHTETFITIAVAFHTFLGSIFKISDYNYRKEQVDVDESND